jgi:pimeloyl-ACP methyl ester carboxylesterase
MASDVLAAMDFLKLGKVAVVGWSDGAATGLDLAINHPDRLMRLWAYGANSNPAGMMDASNATTFNMAIQRSGEQYAVMSPTPKDFDKFMDALTPKWTNEPNFSAADFARITIPVAIADGDHEELIKRENTEEMARLIPGAKLVLLPDVSHFGAWQDPTGYNAALMNFLEASR